MKSHAALKTHWTHLVDDVLPQGAKVHDPVQKNWPVVNNHCFMRIALDNAVGIDRPWSEVVKAPAIKNMTYAQLEAAVDLAERIATGEVELESLDERSLELRGKKSKRKAPDSPVKEEKTPKKRKSETGTISSYFLPSPESSKTTDPKTKPSTKEETETKINPSEPEIKSDPSEREEEDQEYLLTLISTSDLTPFRKLALSLLCQIPPGRYSTYGAMSDFITKSFHKTCARAVGSAMRNNPFAPGVPCHRILAADGSLGGFCGHWGEEGRFANRKHELLHGEGVRFDSKGKVKGSPFREFKAVAMSN